MEQPDLERIVEQALTLARRRGATAAEAGVGVSSGLSVPVRLGEVRLFDDVTEADVRAVLNTP